MTKNQLISKVTGDGLIIILLVCLTGMSVRTLCAKDIKDNSNTAIVNDNRGLSLNGSDSILFTKGNISIEIHMNKGILEERYLVRKDNGWIEITAGKGESIGSVSLRDSSDRVIRGKVIDIMQDETSVNQLLAIGKYIIKRELTVIDDGPWLRVTTQLIGGDSESIHAFFDQFSFTGVPDWSYAPSIGGFIPDAYYKAPVVMYQSNSDAFALVPDLNILNASALNRCNHFIGLDLPSGQLLSVGFTPPALVAHSVYAADQMKTWKPDSIVENSYYMFFSSNAVRQQAYREVVRFHWNQFGRHEQIHAADQQQGSTEMHEQTLTLFDYWRQVVWEQETQELWLDIPLPDGSMGGGVPNFRWGPGPSVYMSSWFNSMRTAYGMALYARRSGNKELLDMAGSTLNLALKSPGNDGTFKCIAVPIPGTQDSVVWGAGDGNGGSTGGGFLGYDMSWTAYWLLRWKEAGLPGAEGVITRCRELAGYFISHQQPDGFIPTRFEENGIVQMELSRMVKAETGPVALFLLQLYKLDKQQKYLDAARDALTFIERSVIPSREWYDYETFWSCSPKSIPYDEITGQKFANNLALSQTVAAYLLAWQLTEDPHYLNTGEALLDYLLLYQQCWTHPLIGGFESKTALLGGFTTQNSDAEWSDARQSQIGNILMDYYRATGKTEYLERGIAALRAQFPISPYENVAHTGYGSKNVTRQQVGHLRAVPPWYTYNRYPEKIRGVSSFHWGTGSGMAGIEIEEEFLRDIAVDMAASRGTGVNGINVTDCKIHDSEIQLEINSPFQWNRDPVIMFHNIPGRGNYHLIINNRDLGIYSSETLGTGVRINVGF
jgi:hypothetical protein